MKKNVLILSLLMTPLIMTAQSIFEKYEDMDHVTSVVVNQKMFKMLANIDIQTNDADADDFINQVKMLDNLTVFTTDNIAVSNSMKKDVTKYIKNSKLEELMRIKDGDQTVNFFVLEGKDDNHVKELLMFVNGLGDLTKNENISINGKQRVIETVLLSLTGDIDLREVSKLTNQLNVPGGEQLKKASKK
ncbi:DUF4252 domain-containing protein [Flavobacteriaceae bacterium]|jgi:hypothetical protein|nr:DUF4252 domain-containing protein [Flavobacteriaceae bacterium]MDC1539577.1 DUF4252 domain-containing protein [Flavobacteriaceae bacterium]